MANEIKARLAVILFKVEAAYGVDAAPDETMALLVRDFKATPKFEFDDKPRIGATHVARGKTLKSAYWEVEGTLAMAGPSVGATFPEPRVAAFLKAGGMEVTTTGVSPNEVHTYAYKSLKTSADPSLTIKYIRFDDDDSTQKVFAFLGCRFTLEHAIGDSPGTISFKGMGLHVPPAVGAFDPNAFDYGDLVEQDDAAPGKGISLTWNGVEVYTKGVKISANRKLGTVKAIQGTYGIKEFTLTSSPGDAYVVEVDDLELSDVAGEFTNIFAETKAALVLTVPTVQGAQYVYSFPNAQYGEFSYEDSDEGVRRISGLKFWPADDSQAGDDAMTVAVSHP